MSSSQLVAISYAGIVAVEVACSLGVALSPTLQMLLLTFFTLFVACQAGRVVATKVRDCRGHSSTLRSPTRSLATCLLPCPPTHPLRSRALPSPLPIRSTPRRTVSPR